MRRNVWKVFGETAGKSPDSMRNNGNFVRFYRRQSSIPSFYSPEKRSRTEKTEGNRRGVLVDLTVQTNRVFFGGGRLLLRGICLKLTAKTYKIREREEESAPFPKKSVVVAAKRCLSENHIEFCGPQRNGDCLFQARRRKNEESDLLDLALQGQDF